MYASMKYVGGNCLLFQSQHDYKLSFHQAK